MPAHTVGNKLVLVEPLILATQTYAGYQRRQVVRSIVSHDSICRRTQTDSKHIARYSYCAHVRSTAMSQRLPANVPTKSVMDISIRDSIGATKNPWRTLLASLEDVSLKSIFIVPIHPPSPIGGDVRHPYAHALKVSRCQIINVPDYRSGK